MRSQPAIRRGWWLDVAYYGTGHARSVAAALAGWPGWLALSVQVVLAVAIAEVGYYAAHRLLHTVPWLWPFHAIHHSIEELDWLAAVRVHPGEQAFTKVCQLVPLYLAGLEPQALATYALFSSSMAFFIHANLRWRVPYLRWLLVTPEYRGGRLHDRRGHSIG